MKKLSYTAALLLVTQCCFSQTIAPLQVLKSKDTKLKLSTLYSLQVADNGSIDLISTVKKDKAERMIVNPDLTIQKTEEITFDFEKDKKEKNQIFKKKSGWGANFEYASVDILKTDVLDVISSDFASKLTGVNTINKGKIGLKTGLGFSVKKGDIQLVTNVLGDRVRTFTVFVPKDEIKVKSDEGKNVVYEFHSSSAEAMQLEFNESDTYNKSKMSGMKSFIDMDADLLLIGNRRPIIKFGKAPSNEDLLPYYYIYKISPKTMDIVAQSKFAEPVGRGIVYRETLKMNQGILLVSAPTNLAKPFDPNTKNYVFRLIGNDTKMKFELNHEVPSGQTQFSQAFEMPDSSIVLIATVNEKRVDKYTNQGTYSIPDDAVFTMTIKNGKVTQSQTVSMADFYANLKTPDGEKPGKLVYNPAWDLIQNTSNEYLPNGGMVSFWSIHYPKPDNKAITLYTGDLALQFSADGKLEAKYWIESKNNVKPPVDAMIIKKKEGEFYWLTYAADETGNLATPYITVLDANNKTISSKKAIGDEDHRISSKFPFVQKSDKSIRFFGFDKKGKEFWAQTVGL